VAQGVSPEFKPQYGKKKMKKGMMQTLNTWTKETKQSKLESFEVGISD
jgi:hypothetical protein